MVGRLQPALGRLKAAPTYTLRIAQAVRNVRLIVAGPDRTTRERGLGAGGFELSAGSGEGLATDPASLVGPPTTEQREKGTGGARDSSCLPGPVRARRLIQQAWWPPTTEQRERGWARRSESDPLAARKLIHLRA
jgi:hypothetical protein